MHTKAQLSYLIKNKAIELGFFKAGISKVEYLSEKEYSYKQWLANNFHGTMQYMENNLEKRFNPALLVENAKSVISVLLNYYPEQEQDTSSSNIPVIAKYAYGRDYHKVMKKMLKQLAVYISEITEMENYRIFVDSAPVLDRTWAEKSGLGWTGKHSLLINKDIGSFFFIGEIILDVELEYDKPVKNLCGNCTACIDACPTQAIINDGVVDANSCISYLTIEHKGEIPERFKGKFKNRIFGCDICQDVCPWNNKKQVSLIDDFKPLARRLNLTFEDWAKMTEEEFNNLFNGTPLKRAKYEGLMRNLRFLTGNGK